MNIDDLITLIKKRIHEYLDKYGETLYSSVSTLSKGDIYLLGTNPGGNGKWLLSEDLKNLRTKNTNEYTDAVWVTDSNPNVEKGKDTLQLRVKELISKSTLCNIEDVCASNLIFFTSKDLKKLKSESGLSFNKAAEVCWPIHEEILKEVQPKVIIVFGNAEYNSPYAFLRKKFKNLISKTEKKETGWGENVAKNFEFSLNGQKCNVVGLPHLSRFAIKDEKVYDWIKKKIEK